jgi:hypothetical protein
MKRKTNKNQNIYFNFPNFEIESSKKKKMMNEILQIIKRDLKKEKK